MPSQAPRIDTWIIAAATMLGLGLRLWPLGGLGLSHFDEGVYAAAGLWPFQRGGFFAIDPGVISYAPPVFPILVGLVYSVLGPSDQAMLLVSQLVGTLTIPVSAWLARRLMPEHRHAPALAAILLATGGPLIAFSRLGLTDATFLLAWLLILGVGVRFLTRPDAWSAIGLGLAVGLAQNTKYNGFLAGAVVACSLVAGAIGGQGGVYLRRGLLWGSLAFLISLLVVAPWVVYVQNHGGYAALLAHQRSYFRGVGLWWDSYQIQVHASMSLSGPIPTLALPLIVWLGFARADRSRLAPDRRAALIVVPGSFLLLGCLFRPWIGLAMLVIRPRLLVDPRPGIRLLSWAWILTVAITPLYHPYARLWLPIEAISYLLLTWVVTGPELADGIPIQLGKNADNRRGVLLIARFAVLFALLLWIAPMTGPRSGLLARSDGLKRAIGQIAARIPKGTPGVSVLGRPAIAFYLAGRVPVGRVADLNFFESGAKVPGQLAILDTAVIGSWSRQRQGDDGIPAGWELIEMVPTDPPIPVRLDLDPDGKAPDVLWKNYPLLLLRAR